MMILIFTMLAVVVMSCFLAAPLAFFTMLFLGNIGMNLSFLTLFPGAIAVRMAFASFAATKEK